MCFTLYAHCIAYTLVRQQLFYIFLKYFTFSSLHLKYYFLFCAFLLLIKYYITVLALIFSMYNACCIRLTNYFDNCLLSAYNLNATHVVELLIIISFIFSNYYFYFFFNSNRKKRQNVFYTFCRPCFSISHPKCSDYFQQQ